MNTNERPTPETDVYIKSAWGSGFAAKELEEPMRRLERERDEARAELDDWRNAAAHVESNHSDEVHCTCVLILQKLLVDARNERDEARDRIAQLETQLAEFQKSKEPETFEAHGLTWIKHTPGDPMPCDGKTEVRVLYDCEKTGGYWHAPDRARFWTWSDERRPNNRIIGWNYADAP